MVILVEVISRDIKNKTNNYRTSENYKQTPYPRRYDEKPSYNKPKPIVSTRKGNKKQELCGFCTQPGHYSREFPKKKKINDFHLENNDKEEPVQAPINNGLRDESSSSSGEEIEFNFINHQDPDEEEEFSVCVITCDGDESVPIAEIQAASNLAQQWDDYCQSPHVEDARLMKCNPEAGKAHLTGIANLTSVVFGDNDFSCLLDSGASCSKVRPSLLFSILPNWDYKLSPIKHAEFHSCSDKLVAVGVVPLTLIFADTRVSVRMEVELVVIRNSKTIYLIMENDHLSLYGFDITVKTDSLQKAMVMRGKNSALVHHL